jgi:hypothetical protein
MTTTPPPWYADENNSGIIQIKKCEVGCKTYTGSEVKHHPDCIYYPNSLSERIDKLAASAPILKALVEKQERMLIIHHDGNWNLKIQSEYNALKREIKILKQQP